MQNMGAVSSMDRSTSESANKVHIGRSRPVYHFPGMKEYIHNDGGFKRDVPSLQEVIVMEGVAHYINQEKPQEINSHIHQFFHKF
ncbi:hypothetical protein TIFTF001_007240 [Ficus carica]|uniref:Epoxide hydrolase n=1 Tax=Ficus carica TaxID=3494 RepID=A0AA87ZPZ9_FICCA|nr:hypothetical protein TIFTF001_007240 [Ficus carica]